MMRIYLMKNKKKSFGNVQKKFVSVDMIYMIKVLIFKLFSIFKFIVLMNL